MVARSRNHNINSVRISPRRILRGLRISAAVTTPSQDSNMLSHLAAIRSTNLWGIGTDQAPQELALDALEDKKIEEHIHVLRMNTSPQWRICTQLLQT